MDRSFVALKVRVEFFKRFGNAINYRTSCASRMSGLLA